MVSFTLTPVPIHSVGSEKKNINYDNYLGQTTVSVSAGMDFVILEISVGYGKPM